LVTLLLTAHPTDGGVIRLANGGDGNGSSGNIGGGSGEVFHGQRHGVWRRDGVATVERTARSAYVNGIWLRCPG
jgi:hypothetical protein